jgi:hypothetical protein
MTQILNLDITTAVSATAGDTFEVPAGFKTLSLEGVFTYGSSGTSAKVYVQTTFDGGVTWVDIACFAFTTASASKAANLSCLTPVTTVYTPTDGSLEDNTVKDGLLGTKIRTKYVTTGTYADSTNLKLYANFK